jgi:flagellar protein FlaG
MALVTDVSAVRSEDAPAAQAAKSKVERAATPPKVSEWQETHQAQLEALIAHMGYRVKFSKDERTGRFVCQIMDKESKKVIHQIPPEEVLAIAARLDEMIGLLFDREL